MPPLTKSLFMSGQQCAKRLWFEVHQPLESQTVLSMPVFNGGDFDRAAQSVGAGALISRDGGLAGAVSATERALVSGDAPALYQAAFRAGQWVAIADVLRRNGKAFDLIENKVATTVKHEHLVDAAFQAFVLEQAGVRLKRTFIGHVNSAFELRQPGQYRGLVTEEDVTTEVRKLKRTIPRLASKGLSVLGRRSAPDIAMGGHCESPYPCPFIDRCSASLPPAPEFPVSILPRGGKLVAALIAEGLHDLKAVPLERLKSETHLRLHAATLSGEPFFAASATRKIRALKPPYSYLDFETLPLAVPRVVGTRPYEQCPFLWSLHIENGDGSVRHIEHLSTEWPNGVDELARALLAALPLRGPVFVYNASLERSALTLLARLTPALKSGIRRVLRRIFDLLPVTRAAYYHPGMRGSWSIKHVVPTIDPALGYEGLTEIRDGGSAQAAFLELLDPSASPGRRADLEMRLKAYCERDTRALLSLRQFLCREIASR